MIRCIRRHWACVAPTALSFLVLHLAGCQSFKGVARCNQVLGSINEELRRAASIYEQPPSSDTYRQLSELFGALESSLASRTDVDGELERATKAYAKQLRKVSRETRNYAQALERLEKANADGNGEQQTKTLEELSQIRERAERLLESVDNEGRRLRDTCHPKG